VAVFIALHLALLQQFVGINAVVGYGGDIAGSAIPSLKSIFPMLINLEQVLTSLIVSYLLSRIGRKTILQIGTIFGAISTGIIGVGFFIHDSNTDVGNVFILLGLVIFMANFGLSLGPVVWLYIPEIVQPSIVPFSTGVNWAGAALVMLLFPIITEILPNKNPGYLFFFFSAWCVASFLINAKYTI
jgi:SP family xylose:H+ symportor-like MFS transporter